MSTDPRIVDIRDRLAKAESADAVRTLLSELDRILQNTPRPEGAEELTQRAVEMLLESVVAPPEAIAAVLLNDVLPLCLSPDEDEYPGLASRLSARFCESLESLQNLERWDIRSAVLARAVRAIGTASTRNALSLIGALEFYDDAAVERLKGLIRDRDDEVGDHALAVCGWCSPSRKPARWLLDELHGRLPLGPREYLVYAVSTIGTAETADLVLREWLGLDRAGSAAGWDPMNGEFVTRAISRICVRHRDRSLAERIWDRILTWIRPDAGQPKAPTLANPAIATRLDVRRIVPDLIRWLPEKSEMQRYFFYAGLRECVLPRHIEGWGDVAVSDLEWVRADATAPSGMVGMSRTVEYDRKQAAWEVLLSCGIADALPPFAEALRGETSGYVVRGLLDLGACLALGPLPQAAMDCLSGTASAEWSESERLVAQTGAIRCVRGAASREAFEALMNYRLIGPGVLLSLVEALADTAMLLQRTGDYEPVRSLLKATTGAPREETRGAAAGAVAILLNAGRIARSEYPGIAELAVAESTDAHPRRELLYAFASRPAEEVPEGLIRFAENLLDGPPQTDWRDPRPAALLLLSKIPGASKNPEFLKDRLGLAPDGDLLRAGPETLLGGAPYIVGRFYAAEPGRFGAVVASLLGSGSSGALAQLLPSVAETGPRAPRDVVDALLARVKRMDAGRTAEPSVVATLAATDPARLIREGCDGLASWLPEARADLGDTLGGIPCLDADAADLRLELLTKLALDGIYGVRRAAYRAASKCEPKRLHLLLQGWFESGDGKDTDLKCRAAEAVGWLDGKAQELLVELEADRESRVRSTCQRSEDEREKRERARYSETRVLSVADPESAVAHWRYGVALGDCGDDDTIRTLADRLAEELHPAVRFWLTKVLDSVDRQWRETLRKWPDPWFARRGQLETFTGTLRQGATERAFAGTLWLEPGGHPGAWSSWGGWGTAEMDPSGNALEAFFGIGSSRKCVLSIPGRAAANILLTFQGEPAGNIAFVGNGGYPEPSN